MVCVCVCVCERACHVAFAVPHNDTPTAAHKWPTKIWYSFYQHNHTIRIPTPSCHLTAGTSASPRPSLPSTMVPSGTSRFCGKCFLYRLCKCILLSRAAAAATPRKKHQTDELGRGYKVWKTKTSHAQELLLVQTLNLVWLCPGWKKKISSFLEECSEESATKHAHTDTL